MEIQRKSRFIAFCGIDGSGKTSLIGNLTKKIDRMIRVVKKSDSRNAMLLRKGLSGSESADVWKDSKYLEIAAVGACIDFYSFFLSDLAGSLDSGQIIFCDRFDLCYRSFLGMADSNFPVDRLFESIVVPDLTIYLDGDLSVFQERLRTRPSNRYSSDEDIYFQSKFRDSYEKHLEFVQSPVLRVNSDGDMESSVVAVLQSPLFQKLLGCPTQESIGGPAVFADSPQS